MKKSRSREILFNVTWARFIFRRNRLVCGRSFFYQKLISGYTYMDVNNDNNNNWVF